jgi:hypothetical protein
MKQEVLNEQAQTRLQELYGQQVAGQQLLADLENRLAETRQTLLRISGAIQVLEELLAAEPGAAD